MKFTNKQLDNFLKGIEEGRINEYNLPEDLYDAIVKYLKKGVFEGFGETLKSVSKLDKELLTQLVENIHIFSGAKTYQQVKEINSLLVDEDGNIRTSSEFNKLGKEKFELWNDVWGETEYNTAIGQSQMAVKWSEIERTKDVLPNLEYSAVIDENTSDICEPLNGIIAPVDDPIWDTISPLNHFNCFVGDTEILQKYGPTKIKDIKIGDEVFTHLKRTRKVLNVMKNHFEGNLIKIFYDASQYFMCTPNHPILTTNGWTTAENITKKDYLITIFGKGIKNIGSIELVHFVGDVYNLTIDEDETYCLQCGNGIIVHNCRCLIMQVDTEPTENYEDKAQEVEGNMQDIFKFNAGKTGEVFTKDHPYFDVPKEDKEYAKRNFDLPINIED